MVPSFESTDERLPQARYVGMMRDLVGSRAQPEAQEASWGRHISRRGIYNIYGDGDMIMVVVVVVMVMMMMIR